MPVGYSHLLVPESRRVLIVLADTQQQDARRSVDDIRIIQRGAASAFPIDQPQA